MKNKEKGVSKGKGEGKMKGKKQRGRETWERRGSNGKGRMGEQK